MEEKTYLKWHNKVGYGSGDIAGNVVYAFLSSFVMIYLTNTIGLNSGIVGTLIAVSKLFDGITDIFFGTMIDRTKSKMGKARPWMFYGFFGCAITLYGVFAIPTNMGKTAQYAWFFICYTLLNAVILFYHILDLFSRLFFDASPVKIPGYRTFGNSRQLCNISHCQLFSHDAFPFLFKNPGEFLRPPGLI